MKRVLIAGGTGLIGQELESKLLLVGYEVYILSRNPKGDNQIFWDPINERIDLTRIRSINVIVNLCGAGVADKRWTSSRKKELYNSRIIPTNFLFSISDQFPKLEQYITASGVNCYGYEERLTNYDELDDFGDDYLSTLVKHWEAAADQFSSLVPVTKLRISMVLTDVGGALDKLAKAVKWGVGSPIASGKQWISWVHMDDLINAVQHAIENSLNGAYNVLGDNTRNELFMKALAKRLGRRIWLPNVPAFMMRLVLGEMSEMLIKGVKVSNAKLIDSGFEFSYTNLDETFISLELK